jgi:hypothetical protein
MALQPEAIKSRIDPLISLLNTYVIPFLFILITAVFIWGVAKFIFQSGDEKARKQAKSIMTWGIIGLFAAAAAWGIVKMLIAYFGVGGVGIPAVRP